MLEGTGDDWHWLLLHAHLIELACHHLLRLHIRELLFHHRHLVSILHLCRILVSFGGLPRTSISHNHTFHHVGERVGAEPGSLLAIGLARATSHCFVEHPRYFLFNNQILFGPRHTTF